MFGTDHEAPRYGKRFLGLLLLASLQCAQAQAPPSSGRAQEAGESSLPRSKILQQKLSEERDWTFYHSIAEMPDEMRAVLFRVAGTDVVGPGESFNDGDIHRYPSNAQHLFTAVSDELGVVVWYGGGFGGALLYAALYDRAVHDVCRFEFRPGRAPTIVMLTKLAGELREARNAGCGPV